LALGVVLMVAVDAQRARYVLALDPPRAGAAARVVVRASRLRGGPARGATLIADTGFQVAALVEPAAAAIAAGERTGRLDAGAAAGGGSAGGGDNAAAVPAWLRDVVSG